MDQYFTKFPTIEYGGTVCTDITRRVKLSDSTKNALTLYYNYQVKDGTRADRIADAYYNDPYLDWLLYLTNEIVDPYYQWNLSEEDFQQFLITKYGSFEASVEKIMMYRNNWYDDDKILTVEFYNNHLPNLHKKYYSPFYGDGTKILHWERRKEDWVMETNEIWKGTVANNTFEVGDLVVMGAPAASPAIIVATTIFNGEVEAVDDDLVFIKNVSYTVNPEDLGAIAPAADVSDTKTITDISLVYRAIELDEAVFWSPVTAYDIELERNTYNQSIKILDSSFQLQVSEDLRKILAQ